MINFLSRAFSSVSGIPSSTRILSAIVIVDVLGVWTYECIYRAAFISLGYDNCFLILSCLGIKAYQRKIEGESNECKVDAD